MSLKRVLYPIAKVFELIDSHSDITNQNFLIPDFLMTVLSLYEMILANSDLYICLIGYLPSHIQHTLIEQLIYNKKTYPTTDKGLFISVGVQYLICLHNLNSRKLLLLLLLLLLINISIR